MSVKDKRKSKSSIWAELHASGVSEEEAETMYLEQNWREIWSLES